MIILKIMFSISYQIILGKEFPSLPPEIFQRPPPFTRYLQADIEAFDIRELTPKFDVILLEPPLEEYYRETGITANEKCWTWDDVR